MVLAGGKVFLAVEASRHSRASLQRAAQPDSLYIFSASFGSIKAICLIGTAAGLSSPVYETILLVSTSGELRGGQWL